ncbi:FMN-binding protein [Prevotella sp. E9-3]|uniref:FMN-binding protein n=1 Tax=Prevotella sp. E9-3 TaxID=2913621 RepID=UPI001EDA1B3A|nr:FMN-binding protein [Prevotella sp. E9-3]UKK47116.1 FMN-binding protein [Prevotella sp. E9-3]
MSKLNTNSNSYIIIYSAILVVVVAFLLAFIFKALKPMQDANVALDIKKQILYSLNIRNLDGAEAEAKYAEVVKEEKELNGQKFYECEIDGNEILVASLKGMGLWGGISGYMAVDNEGKVYGAYFNHEGETAGLGAEIKDSQAWQEKFIGKRIWDDDNNVVLSVVKKVEDPATQVDCVTGATLTSNGVDAMLKEGLKNVENYVVGRLNEVIASQKETVDSAAVAECVDSTIVKE